MKTVLVLTKDLFFTGKINAALQNLGEPLGPWRGVIVRSAADFRKHLAEEDLVLALVDTTAQQAEPENLIREHGGRVARARLRCAYQPAEFASGAGSGGISGGSQ